MSEVKVAYFKRFHKGRNEKAVTSGDRLHLMIKQGWQQITRDEFLTADGHIALLNLRINPLPRQS